MIKINLLNSVTERQSGAAVVVERKIASPTSRLLMMSLAVLCLLIAVIGWDVISTQMAKVDAQRQLEEQNKVAAELEAVTKEMKELETKISSIDSRIEAIKTLRAAQAGPSAVLQAVTERIAMVPGLYLESIEQTGEQVTIKGSSPDESAVTQFGRSLEFSSGLFSNLNIETQRKEAPNQKISATVEGKDAPPKEEIVGFTIRCAYTPSKSGASQNQPMTAANMPPAPGGVNGIKDAVKEQLPKAPAQSDGAPPPQVAKNQ